MMMKSEEAIGKVLAGLRDSEVPLGMEHRVLKAVQDHASVQSRSGWRWLRPNWLVAPSPIMRRSLFLAVASAGILAIVFAIPSPYRAHRGRDAAAQLKITAASVGPPAKASLVARGSPVSPPASVIHSPATRQERKVRLVRRDDSLALREVRAASRPAPPLPLTKQEKLLLRVARTAGPEELAMLNPDERARRRAESDAEFQQFFGKSTAKHDEQN